MLASGSSDETLRLWDIKNGKCMLIIPAHADPILVFVSVRMGA